MKKIIALMFVCIFFFTGCGNKDEIQWSWLLEPGEYEDISLVGEELIGVQMPDGKWKLLSVKDGMSILGEYEGISQFSEGMAVAGFDGKCMYIDENGKVVINEYFQEARPFHESLAAVKDGEYWGYIDTTGAIVIPCQYDEAGSFHEGMAAVRMGEKWGVIDTTGNIVVECIYDLICDFHEGYAAVKSDNKWGYINQQGQLSISCHYDSVGNFSEGKAAVQIKKYKNGNDEWAYIDSKENIVIDFYPYDASEGRMILVDEFEDGKAFVSKTLYCVIDENGNTIFNGDSKFFISTPTYEQEYNIIPGYVYIDSQMKIKKYGFMGLDGEQRVEPIFDYIDEISGKYVVVSMIEDGEYRKGVIVLNEK